jgi:hypothetical protein
MSVSSVNVSDDAVELPTCRISLMIPFIEIGEDAEELATIESHRRFLSIISVTKIQWHFPQIRSD